MASREPSAAIGRLSEAEEVFDGWAWYRVRIETRTRFGKPRYRWVAERRFTHWEVWREGVWTRSLDRAVKRGEKYLAKKSRRRYEEVGYVRES